MEPETSPSQSTAQERYRQMKAAAAAKAKPRPRTPRAASPTRVIEPGIVHYRAAAAVLRGLQSKAQEAGLPLDIGELPEGMTDTTDTTDDPERLARITAHAIARFADRFDFVRKFSRHMEGTDKKAGILSDIFAALVELYKRNPRVFEHAAKSYALEIHKQHQTRKAQQTSTPTNHTDPIGGSNHATP